MVGFLVAYTVIAGVASKTLANWSVRWGFTETWLGAFKGAFIVSFVLLWLGHAVVW